MRLQMRMLIRNPLWWAVSLTGLYLLILATRPSPFFFGPAEWQWHTRPPASSTYSRWWPAVMLLTGYVLLFWRLDGHWAERPSRRREWAMLFLLLLAAPALQIALTYIHYRHPVEFYLSRTIGPHNGFWQVAISNDNLAHYLRTYPQQMQAYPFVHTPVHPPGDFVYVWLWRKGLEALPGLSRVVAQYFRTYHCGQLWFVTLKDAQIASALAQMLVPLFSGLVVIPLYFLGKRLVGPRVGLRAAALYIAVPALNLFTMRWDQLYPLFLCLSLYWLQRGLSDHRNEFFFLSGLAVSVASFMSFGNATILAALAVYGLAHLAAAGLRRQREWLRQTWAGWALVALGVASVWLVYQMMYGVSFWDVFSTAMQTHFYLGRSYGVWVGYNLYDFAIFVGLPVAVFFVVESARAWRGVPKLFKRDPLSREMLLAFTLGVTLLALDLTGVARGEVGRMWLLWMPLACLAAAIGLARQKRAGVFRLALALMVLQTLFSALFLRVSATGMPDYQPRTLVTAPPTAAYPLDTQLGGRVALVGYDLEPAHPRPGDTLHLTLYWQALAQMDTPYTVFTHLLDESGALRGQQDNMPARGELPTTCWRPGEYVADPYDISIASDAPSGWYTLQVGMYNLATSERLSVSDPSGQPSDRVLLAPVQVVTP